MHRHFLAGGRPQYLYDDLVISIKEAKRYFTEELNLVNPSWLAITSHDMIDGGLCDEHLQNITEQELAFILLKYPDLHKKFNV